MYFYYTYYVIHVETNQKYYGVRKSKLSPEKDLWKKYFTSSKKVHALIKQYGVNSFIVQVRKQFNDFDAAQNWEAKVLTRLKVTKKNDWLNYNIRGSKFKNIGPRDPTIMKKVKETQYKIYGNFAFRQEKVLKKQKETWKKKYGTDNFSQVGKLAFKNKTGYDNIRNIKAICPHCGKNGQYVALKRWHYDNCKSNK